MGLSDALQTAGAIAAAFAIGGIPWSLLLGFLLGGVDIRTRGSGNVGATNLGRVCGWRYFPLAFLLDAAKGFAPVAAGREIIGAGPLAPVVLDAALALAAVMGHVFSPFLRFRGGKGVATAAGALAALMPAPTAAAAGVWLCVFALSRTVGVASSAAALALPAAFFALDGRDAQETAVLGAASTILSLQPRPVFSTRSPRMVDFCGDTSHGRRTVQHPRRHRASAPRAAARGRAVVRRGRPALDAGAAEPGR